MHDIHSFGAYVNENADCRDTGMLHLRGVIAAIAAVNRYSLRALIFFFVRRLLLTPHLIPLILFAYFGDKIVGFLCCGC